MQPRAKGHLLSPADFRRGLPRLPGKVVGLGSSLPSEVGYSQYVDYVRDQGDAEACEGFGWARMIDVRAKVQGFNIPYPSEYAIWTLARGNGRVPLQNVGVATAIVTAALGVFGVVSEGRIPWPSSGWTSTLPADVFRHGADALVTGVYAVDGVGADRCLQLRQALASGYIPGFAMQVDASYEAGPGVLYTGPTGPSLGWHFQSILGYQAGKFLVCGSWGPMWNAGGYAWISDDFMGNVDLVDDTYVVDVAPSVVS